ncbi:hypothetical protein [Halobacillus litoralis]|uniref:hypothetical protein n=1 Tax=Halobacillus litoralis TaxID=45668 RepID=UPI001CFD6069|nr:hypothetical protein [Halobacillus litoralis]
MLDFYILFGLGGLGIFVALAGCGFVIFRKIGQMDQMEKILKLEAEIKRMKKGDKDGDDV